MKNKKPEDTLLQAVSDLYIREWMIPGYNTTQPG
jgi:hypothetical protein